jgi:hypothetical protein
MLLYVVLTKIVDFGWDPKVVLWNELLIAGTEVQAFFEFLLAYSWVLLIIGWVG